MMKKISFLFSFIFLVGLGSLSAQWPQTGGDIDGEASGDRSGHSVSMSSDGQSLAIGAPFNDGGGNSAGHVRVFEKIGGVWVQVGNDINGTAPGDKSGFSVSLSADGMRVAIGAPFNDGGGNNAGQVRVYDKIGGGGGAGWVQVGDDINGTAPGDQFGFAVSLSAAGDRLVVGAPFHDGNGSNSGRVRVYEEIGGGGGGGWVQVGDDINGTVPGDQFGFTVSLSAAGDRLVVGAPFHNGNGPNSGQVRVYEENGNVWMPQGNEINGEAAGDQFGYSVSIAGNGLRLAVGAPFNTDAGSVQVFEDLGGDWGSLPGEELKGAKANCFYGHSVSMAGNGLRLAVGAPGNDENGTDAGQTWVYTQVGSTWEILSSIKGVSGNDVSGSSVSLCSSGHCVAIGAPGNDSNGNNAGHVRVYKQPPCDADMDGFANASCGGADCNDNDASINPGATEICNGIDDNCDGMVDEGNIDTDGDDICDNIDNCPAIVNADQADADSDGAGDVCDVCPNDPNNDADGDNFCGDLDNCPSIANSGQEDSDCDMVGDVCDICPGGDDSVDNNSDGIPDCSQLLNYAAYSSDWKCGTNKIYVCHSGTTQCINKNQLPTHFNHGGDNIGPCISCANQNLTMPGSNDIPIDVGNVEMAEQYETDDSGMVIFPNPVSDLLQIDYRGSIDEIRIVSAQGMGIHSFETDADFRNISLEQMPSGLYVLMIRSAGSWVTKKFIKI